MQAWNLLKRKLIMNQLIKIFVLLIIAAVLIAGVARWYTLVIKGSYYANASFFASAMVTLLPLAFFILLVWLALKIINKPTY